jgi:DNA polymerase III alpha subunit
VNRKTLEALVKAGAFDFEKRPRRQLFDSIDRAMERGASTQRDKASGQSSLFGLLAGPAVGAKGSAGDYVKIDEWPEKERLSFEKEAIGFYVSGHPLDQYQKELRRYARPVTSIQRARKDEKIAVAGVVAVVEDGPQPCRGVAEVACDLPTLALPPTPTPASVPTLAATGVEDASPVLVPVALVALGLGALLLSFARRARRAGAHRRG